jgi:Fe-S cluster assembly ATP-binding protein
MLELKDLEFSVKGAGDRSGETIDIIKGISLAIEDDKFTVITGPNGGGKSTLAKLIMGVERPTGGQIIFDGTDITDLPINERARLGIGFAFQQPARFKGMTVKKLLAISAKQKGSCLECNTYLSKVGLCSKDYLNREVDKSLSGGELKRIEIATVLARDPKLALYDEPEAGIDLWSFDRLTETFRDIHAARDGRSIVIISHQERIIDLADDIVLIKDGQIEKMGPRVEIAPELGFFSSINPDCSKTYQLEEQANQAAGLV